MDNRYAELIERYTFPQQAGWVRPAYDGQSIVNLANSLQALFGIKSNLPLTFYDQLATALRGKRKLIFLLLDGLGWGNVFAAAQRIPVIEEIVASATCWPLTSVSPSTTSTATTSYLTGLTPGQHSVLGFLMYFPEYQRVFNMLHFTTPVAPHEELLKCGFDPEAFIPEPSILQTMQAAGVMAAAYNYQAYAGSGLSRLVYHADLPYAFQALGDLCATAISLLTVNAPQFQLLYWSNLDTIAHTQGAGSHAYAIELAMMLTTIRDRILPCCGDDVAVLVSADHGHIDGNDAEAIALSEIPGLTDTFRLVPAGEGRLTQLFIKPGEAEHARDLLCEAGNMLVMTRDEYLESGLLGIPPFRQDVPDRIGELVVFPHGSRRTLFAYESRPHTAMIGRHGGLTPEEMVVPLLVWA